MRRWTKRYSYFLNTRQQRVLRWRMPFRTFANPYPCRRLRRRKRKMKNLKASVRNREFNWYRNCSWAMPNATHRIRRCVPASTYMRHIRLYSNRSLNMIHTMRATLRVRVLRNENMYALCWQMSAIFTMFNHMLGEGVRAHHQSIQKCERKEWK